MKRLFAAAGGGLLVMALAAGCGSAGAPGSAPPASRSSASAPAGSVPASSVPASSAPASGLPGGAHAAVPSGGPVPAGFRATSVTFLSARDAFVLGTAPCRRAPCTSVVRTYDRGLSWRGLPAPAVPLGNPVQEGTAPAAWGIRFGTARHGFVFGNGLWVTTDGGEHWSAAPYPGGSIMSLEIIDHQVLALTSRRGPDGSARITLLRRAFAGGPWARLAAWTGLTGGIATQARVAAVISGSSVLVTGNGGLSITRRALPCTAGGFPSPASVAVAAPRGLALLCMGDGAAGSMEKSVYMSGDLGSTWKLASRAFSRGIGGTISAAAPGHLTIATASAASWLYFSADSGRTWRTAMTSLDGGAGWADLGFTTGSAGAVVHGRPGQLLLTENGGQSWHAVRF